MTKGYEPLNQTERDILETLSRLSKGLPLGDLDKGTIIVREEEGSLESYIKTKVVESRQRGKISSREAIWIIGSRGGGKTERLISLENQLLVEEFKEGYGKSAIASINLKDRPQAQIQEGLQSYIFTKILATSSSSSKDAITKFVQFQKDCFQIDQVQENFISTGFDILFSILNISVPGLSTIVSIAGTGLFSNIKSRYSLRRNAIKRHLESHSITDRVVVELIIRWIKYSVKPTESNWSVFYDYFQRLASEGSLFKILCQVLDKSGFSTLILLFDEVDRLTEGIGLTQAFERLWDTPKTDDPLCHKVNIIFVLAVSNPVDILRDETKYSGFSRRFMGTAIVPAQQFILNTPRVNEATNYNDDCSHAMGIIRSLIGRLTGVHMPKVSNEEELDLRKRLVRLSNENKLTWHELWAAVSKLYNPLS